MLLFTKVVLRILLSRQRRQFTLLSLFVVKDYIYIVTHACVHIAVSACGLSIHNTCTVGQLNTAIYCSLFQELRII